ncbi:MAG TPA: transcription elongation factor GreA [Elusimicrobia bacterium]|nr:transcription elongation factor GreA [Elusimicrobiota bacterium]
MTETYMTRAGQEKLLNDLEELKKRKAILSVEIGEAREKGDLRENAEYHSAKERLAEVMNRISILETKLSGAQIIDNLKIKEGEVQIGVRVTLLDVEDKDEMQWTLVGQEESDPASGLISIYAPLAQGILGHKVGEEVCVELPVGPKKFKILKTEPAF